MLISVTQGSYVKRTPLSAYRAQRRGGRGVQGMRTKDEDEVVDLYLGAHARSRPLLHQPRPGLRPARLCPARRGARRPRAADGQLPEPGRRRAGDDAAGRARFLSRPSTSPCSPARARIKRVKLSEFEAVRPSGIIAMNLEPGDELGWARATSGDQEFIIVTAQRPGAALRRDRGSGDGPHGGGCGGDPPHQR